MATEDEIGNYLEFAVNLTKNAGKLIKERNFDRNKIKTKENKIDFVTEIDIKVENILRTHLAKEYPTHQFIGEETTTTAINLTEAPTWIIDPIDGTMNFVHGFPHCCISLGLLINLEPVIGIIYNPNLEQLFTAQKGRGAFLNNQPIKVSNTKTLEDALLMFSVNQSGDASKAVPRFENYQKLIPLVHGIRNLGSAALNMGMVAMGGADAYFETGIRIWDFVAGEIIVKEAGGVVCDPAGGPLDRLSRRMMCAGTPELAEILVQLISQHYPGRD